MSEYATGTTINGFQNRYIGKEINSLDRTILINNPINCPGASKVYGNSSFF
jgi:hypothetical protein